MSKITRIKGFADYFPPESEAFTFMENAARDVFSRYGYRELRTPVLEKTELFARSIGEETDVVKKEMYTFPDRKDRSLTLRPEATAGVMRSYIESGLATREPYSKLFTFGPMFRYERPQKGRMRQFHQINAECLGLTEPSVDAEVVAMLWQFLSSIRIPNLSLEINTLGCRECRPAYNEALKAYLDSVPEDGWCEDCLRRKSTNPLRVLDCKVPGCKALVDNAPALVDSVCEECSDHFGQVLAHLDDIEIPYTVNKRLVRGLDYYNRTTFEVTSGEIGSQSAVAGGGRYDGLIRDLGGPDQPGIGFACGMERLLLLLPEEEAPRPDVYLAILDEAGMARGFLILQAMRARGIIAEMSPAPKSVKAMMRQANRLRSRFCLLMGPDEIARDVVQVKNLDSGDQNDFSVTSESDLDALADFLR
ncbi:histidine--tRNA ligase [Oceanidesulfovibrio marinus]|uniref:Histidine--tRNA ligase n=1 Tax=Oceanidesulfovibrio marinus TaxID=370038 RepID=A0A6P1ZJQ9_9BACT|nr:histidine--tRNA ligase [Oceanidesulfovibrio marinus]TVM35842.1 histidine--tRNA ligase [Oceanidesulfovibrio marinus]